MKQNSRALALLLGSVVFLAKTTNADHITQDYCDFDTQIVNLDGECAACAPCTEPDPSQIIKTKCSNISASAICDGYGNLIIPCNAENGEYRDQHYGSCKKCGNCTKPNAAGTACQNKSLSDICDGHGHPLTPCIAEYGEYRDHNSWTCKKCGNCTEPNAAGTACQNVADMQLCISQICDITKDKLLPDYTCENCDVCQQPNRFAVNGPYTACTQKPNYDTCMLTACDFKTQVLSEGQCKTCDLCMEPAQDKKSCIRKPDYSSCIDNSYCNWNSQYIKDNKCINCDKCQVTDNSRLACIKTSNYSTCMAPAPAPQPVLLLQNVSIRPQIICPSKQFITNDYQCADCPPGQVADAWQTGCYAYAAPQAQYISAPQPTYPASQPTYPALEPTYLASQPKTYIPVPQPSYPAPQPSYQAHQPSYPAPQPTYPAPQSTNIPQVFPNSKPNRAPRNCNKRFQDC